MKKVLSIVLCVTIALLQFYIATVSVTAENVDCINLSTSYAEGTDDTDTEHSFNFQYVILDDGTAKITKYTGFDIELYIPETLNGYVVSSIGDFAFEGRESLDSVGIPSNIISISDSAFSGCTELMMINVAEDNKYYSSCDGVLFDKEKTEILCYPFGRKNTSYSIPSGVKTIGDSIFFNCTSLQNITIPNTVLSIGEGAFMYCTNLTSVTIPHSVTTIERSAFAECVNLKSITLGKEIKSIGEFAFWCMDWEETQVDFVIYGTKGTEAERYAKDNGIDFIEIKETNIGDADKDGSVTIVDATLIQKWLARLVTDNDIDLSAADTDKDKYVTISDATKIQKFLAGLIEEM